MQSSGKTTSAIMLSTLLAATAVGTSAIAADEQMADEQNTAPQSQTQSQGPSPSLSDDLNQFERNRGSYTNSAADPDIRANDDDMGNVTPAERSERVQNLEQDVHDYYNENDSRGNKARKAADTKPYDQSDKSKAIANDVEQFEENRGSYTDSTADPVSEDAADMPSQKMNDTDQDAVEQ